MAITLAEDRQIGAKIKKTGFDLTARNFFFIHSLNQIYLHWVLIIYQIA